MPNGSTYRNTLMEHPLPSILNDQTFPNPLCLHGMWHASDVEDECRIEVTRLGFGHFDVDCGVVTGDDRNRNDSNGDSGVDVNGVSDVGCLSVNNDDYRGGTSGGNSVRSAQRFGGTECSNEVLQTMKRHFKQHTLLSGQDPPSIYHDAVVEMFTYCRLKELPFVWMYLYTNWYNPQAWCLCARSSSTTLSEFRTSMLVESHFSILKFRFLKVVNWSAFFHIKIQIPQEHYIHEDSVGNISPSAGLFDVLAHNNSTRVVCREVFNFNKFASGTPEAKLGTKFQPNLYDTCILQWICTCPAYQYNEHFLCKHLVSAFVRETYDTTANYYLAPAFKVRRYTHPLWVFPKTKREMLAAEKDKTMYFTVDNTVATGTIAGTSTAPRNPKSTGDGDVGTAGRNNVDLDNHSVQDTHDKLASIRDICQRAIVTSTNNACNPEFVDTVLQLLTPTMKFLDKAGEVDNLRKRQRTNAPIRNDLRRYEPPHA
ncbi:hypothetical protein AaE_014173 [Aphanomyces astaci]|uniref:SWIM-type domain-containing protein n=2 Tax=Aphanomyces astaci TaxID=112090 RepID=A0A6A4Z7P7_APHAT|nr:hypothetical protein AaE_014173 [Aphanomyces astaci]